MLFPAYAGVILMTSVFSLAIVAFPRLRGGDPFFFQTMDEDSVFSPPTRG